MSIARPASNEAPVGRPLALATTGRRCTVCSHTKREAIDQALVAGDGPRPLAARFGLSKQAITRHRDNHVPTPTMREAAQAAVAAEGAIGVSMVADATALRDRALVLLGKAESAGDLKTALAGVREASRCLELMARLAGELDTGTVTNVNVLIQPQFVVIQQAILTALAPYPQARGAVIQALEGIRG